MEETTHPVLATVAFLVSLVFGVPNSEEGTMTGIPPAPVEPIKITVSPDPLVQGQSGKICYDFDKEDPDPVTLEITWFTLSGSTVQTINVTRSNPCETVQVPSDAVSVTIADQSGGAADYNGSVQP